MSFMELRKLFQEHKYVLLPFLFAIFPGIFHYANNATILVLSNLIDIIAYFALLALGLYFIYWMFNKHNPVQAANAASVFLIFFHTYGFAYRALLKFDIIRVEQYTLLPFFVLLAIYVSRLIVKLKESISIKLWNNVSLLIGVLITFNIVKIVPAEFEKWQIPTSKTQAQSDVNQTEVQTLPDIYYFVFDEFAGFESMREYWHYNDIDKFKQFLVDNGFFVAEQSHGATDLTKYELSTRLNYQDYPCCDKKYNPIYFEAIANNQVMRYLKSQGYTTVAFEQARDWFPADVPLVVDYLFESDPEFLTNNEISQVDNFQMMVLDNTMVSAFSKLYKPQITDKYLNKHRNMIYYTMNKVRDLNEVKSPKFVYVHLLIPHMPFMFDKNGNGVDQSHVWDWDYYLGNYIYATKIIEQIMVGLLSQADPERPPVIILQSDHGARNQIYQGNENHLLKNYPEEFKTDILFALYMPGYDFTNLPQDINPINTFPIVFNYLFAANIPLK